MENIPVDHSVSHKYLSGNVNLILFKSPWLGVLWSSGYNVRFPSVRRAGSLASFGDLVMMDVIYGGGMLGIRRSQGDSTNTIWWWRNGVGSNIVSVPDYDGSGWRNVPLHDFNDLEKLQEFLLFA